MRKNSQANEMREEYDFSGGVRGKYAARTRPADVALKDLRDEAAQRDTVDAALSAFLGSFRSAAESVGVDADRIQPTKWLLAQAEQLVQNTPGGGNADELVAHLLYEITCAPTFAADLRARFSAVDVLNARLGILDEVWDAHRSHHFRLTVPALVGLFEGALVDLEAARSGTGATHAGRSRAAAVLAQIDLSADAVALGRAEVYATEAVSSRLLVFLHGLATALESVSKT